MFDKPNSGVLGHLMDQQGASAVAVAVLMSLLVGVAALSIDVGHALVTKNELQNAADAAALAAGRTLGETYRSWSAEQQKDPTMGLASTEITTIETSAITIAGLNSASDASSLVLSVTDIELGQWNFNAANPVFVPGVVQPNAIRTTVRRDNTANGNANGPISTFFAGIFGVTDMNVAATAVAALTTAGGNANEGAVDAPFGLDEELMRGAMCGNQIKFSPTTDSCAAWHNYTNPSHSASAMEATVNGLTAGTFASPPVEVGHTHFEFMGGEVNSLFNDLRALWDLKGVDNGVELRDAAGNPMLDSKGNDFTIDKATGNFPMRQDWSVTIPVYRDPGTTVDANGNVSCANAGGQLVIVGFARATITYVGAGGSDNEIFAEIECGTYADVAPKPNPGTGPSFPWDPKSPYPRLVS